MGWTSYNNLVISGTGNSGITIKSGTSGGGGLAFNDAAGGIRGSVAYDHSNDSMPFVVAGGEKMRIDSSGNVLVGKTSSTTAGLVQIQSTEWSIGSECTGSGTLGHIAFYRPALVGSISTTASATSYNTSSDYRLKEDWVPMSDSIARVKALNPVNFAWKIDGTRVDGFLAHEAQEIVPEAVTGEKDAVDKDGKPEYQGMDYGKITPLLTAALQEAIAEIEALKIRVAELESK